MTLNLFRSIQVPRFTSEFHRIPKYTLSYENVSILTIFISFAIVDSVQGGALNKREAREAREARAINEYRTNVIGVK